MARYTCSYRVKIAPEKLQFLLIEILHSRGFEVTYQASDYLMAREIPGKIIFSKLAIVEIIIDRTTAIADEIRMTLTVKNDELPLRLDNYCRQQFDLVQLALVENSQWRLIESTTK
jgi:hypothetical protein